MNGLQEFASCNKMKCNTNANDLVDSLTDCLIDRDSLIGSHTHTHNWIHTSLGLQLDTNDAVGRAEIDTGHSRTPSVSHLGHQTKGSHD